MHSRFRAQVVLLVLGLLMSVLDVSAQAGQQAGQPGGQRGGQQSGQQGGQQVRRDGREDAPEALIGTWILNVDKSKYDPGPPPKSQVRTFDYTHDGMVLCNYTIVNASGSRTVGHWAVTLDGKEHPEYLRSSGATVYALVGIKKVDQSTLEITVRRFGTLIQTGTWKLSQDGKTLTQTLINTEAQPRRAHNVAVFEKQE